jgi:hypothetical protein
MNSHNLNWIKQYIELMLAENPDEAIPMKLDNFPDRFYRYCALTDCNLLNLEKQQLWLSKIEKLNDPFECGMMFDKLASIRLFFGSDLFRDEFQRNIGMRITDAEVTAIISSNNPYEAYLLFCSAKGIAISQSFGEHNAEVMKRWRDILEEVKEKIRVCCFTTRNDSIRMWSHYAQRHSGICIEYDFLDSKNIRFILQPIYYCNEIFRIKTFEDLTIVTSIMAALHKSTDWSYESEWRVTGFPLANGLVSETVNAPNPTAIYTGVRFENNEPAMKARLRDLAQRKGIPLIEMMQDPFEYKIVKKTNVPYSNLRDQAAPS